jgi:hypothetical protein
VRLIPKIFSSASLTLFMLTATAWIYSHRTWRTVQWNSTAQTTDVGIVLVCGRVSINWTRVGDPFANLVPGWFTDTRPASEFDPVKNEEGWRRQNVRFRVAGIIIATKRFPGFNGWYLQLPLWLITMPALVLPLIALRRWCVGRYRRLSGLCPSCGYDLRESKDRCPECGRAIVPDAEKGRRPNTSQKRGVAS